MRFAPQKATMSSTMSDPKSQRMLPVLLCADYVSPKAALESTLLDIIYNLLLDFLAIRA